MSNDDWLIVLSGKFVQTVNQQSLNTTNQQLPVTKMCRSTTSHHQTSSTTISADE